MTEEQKHRLVWRIEDAIKDCIRLEGSMAEPGSPERAQHEKEADRLLDYTFSLVHRLAFGGKAA